MAEAWLKKQWAEGWEVVPLGKAVAAGAG